MADTKPVGNECPYCGGVMAVTRMSCAHCHVAVEAAFPMSRLATLPVEHQRFIEMFVLAGGNLKEIAEQVGVSYPTIRSRLDKVIEQLRAEIAKTRSVRGNLLDAFDPKSKGGAEEAARLIKEIETTDHAMTQDPNTLDYATPTRRRTSPTRQRVLYCISLPLIVGGLALSQGAGDRLLGAGVAAFGALLLGFALPLSSDGGGR